MLVAERQQKIVGLVNEKKSMRVTELGRIFSVTEETIRRDLETLEKEKKLIRSHGGAVCVQSSNTVETHYSQREVMHVKEKNEIAVEAIKYVKEGDKIILDASTTAWYMAKLLPDIPLTVLTNSIKVSMELSKNKQMRVISTGGTLLPKSLSFVGPLAETSLDVYHVDKAFISCQGLHLERGISESNEQQAIIKKKMLDTADVIFVMVDYSKVGVQAFSQLSGLEKIDYVITDNNVDNHVISQFENRSINVISVE